MRVGYVMTFAIITIIASVMLGILSKQDKWAVGLGTFLVMILLGVVIFMSATLLGNL